MVALVPAASLLPQTFAAASQIAILNQKNPALPSAVKTQAALWSSGVGAKQHY